MAQISSLEPKSPSQKDSINRDENEDLPFDTDLEAMTETSAAKLLNEKTVNKPVVNENHRHHLIMEAEALTRLKKLEGEKSVILNNALTEHLSAKGFEFHSEVNECAAEKYHATLERLYKVVKKKLTLEEMMNKEKLDVMAKKNDVEEERSRLKKELSDTMIETGNSFITKGSFQPLPARLVVTAVHKFIKTHDEMSSARYDFITVQNRLAELKAKEDQLDDLGDGYQVLAYENLKTEVQTFSSNIDMKHEQLDKLRQRFKSETLKFEAFEDKRNQILEIIKQEKAQHEALRIDEELLRSKLNKLKMMKSKLRDEHNKLSAKAGLLNRVLLMKNYDDVTDEVLKISKEISYQETTIAKLTEQSNSLKNKSSNLKLATPAQTF